MDDWEQVKLLMRSVRNGVPDVTAITGREGVSQKSNICSSSLTAQLQHPSTEPMLSASINESMQNRKCTAAAMCYLRRCVGASRMGGCHQLEPERTCQRLL